MTFDVIAEILALEEIPKEFILVKLFGNYKEIFFPISGVLSNSIIFLFSTLVLLLIPIIEFFMKFFLKAFPILLKFLEKLKNVVCWNMIIKAFQTGFLTYALEAIKGINRYIYNEQPNVPDFAISITILIVLIVLIILNCTFTLFSSPEKFC
jgi:hypothetical protein